MGRCGQNGMKAKITEDSITFKISEEELCKLLLDSYLETRTMIAKSSFCLVIDLNAHGLFDDFKEIDLLLIPDRAESCILLRMTPTEVRKLQDMGKDKNGLCMKIDDLDVYLQVDVRGDSRAKRV